jgi:DHA1 family inner membrane transport protein
MADNRNTTRAVAALIALALSTFTYVTAETLPIGLLLPIAHDLHSTVSAVGLLVTFYGLVVVLTSIPLTQLTRRIPRRFILAALLGVFVLTTVVSAFAATYWILMVARVFTALSQALFWSIVVPAAANLFSAQARGRAVSVVFGGSSLAAVLGIPAGTWLGQITSWRVSFLALSGVGLIALIGVARLLPTEAPQQGTAARGSAPNAAKYILLMTMAVLVTTGSFVVFTYVSPFLTDATELSAKTIGPVLFIRGVAGIFGVAISGPLADLSSWLSMVVPIVLQGASFLGMYLFSHNAPITIACVAVSGMSFAVLTTALSSRVLEIAPGSVDIAASGASTAVNLGITAGAFIGSLLVPAYGLRSIALVGAVLSVAALAVVAAEPLARSRPQPGAEDEAADAAANSPLSSAPA